MTPRVRAFLGMFVLFLGLQMVGWGIAKRHVLWQGIRTKTVTVEKQVEAKKPEPTPDGQQSSGPVKIEIRWEIGNKGLPSYGSSTGEYQLRDRDNRIWVMNFCSPYPDLHSHGVYDITYLKDSPKDCTKFVNAKVIEEGTK